jgi:aryl-alcohol dehydrogenase-like predicted oxidoreductase
MASLVGDPNVAGNHRKNMVQTLENSLRSLQTDYLDVLWVHAYDAVTPIEEMMRALDDLVRAGKVLYVGISNAPAWVVARANTMAELRGWTQFAGVQVQYSLIERTAERDLIPMSRALDVAVTAWAPLGSGLLTGKYNAGPGAEPRRLDQSQATPVNDRNLAIAATVSQIAHELGCSPARVALAWVRAKGAIPIVGARTLAQFSDNLASLAVSLDAECLRRLDEVSEIAPGYPHDFLGRGNIRTSVFGGMFDSLDLGGR